MFRLFCACRGGAFSQGILRPVRGCPQRTSNPRLTALSIGRLPGVLEQLPGFDSQLHLQGAGGETRLLLNGRSQIIDTVV